MSSREPATLTGKSSPVAPQQLTVVTRQRLLDLLVVEKVWWWGALDEVRFLERLYDLDALEGDGFRRLTAREDITQHCLNNDDWPPEWVFTDDRFGLNGDSPQPLLRFLAEMLHPVVRRDPAEVQHLAGKFNDLLAADGFELYPAEYISGLPVYAGGARATFHGARPDWKFESRPLLTDPRVLHEHQERIRAGLERDPAAAIASCKELCQRHGGQDPAHTHHNGAGPGRVAEPARPRPRARCTEPSADPTCLAGAEQHRDRDGVRARHLAGPHRSRETPTSLSMTSRPASPRLVSARSLSTVSLPHLAPIAGAAHHTQALLLTNAEAADWLAANCRPRGGQPSLGLANEVAFDRMTATRGPRAGRLTAAQAGSRRRS